MNERILSRLILKEEDVLLVHVPSDISKRYYKVLYEHIKRKLLPRRNKIIMLPKNIEISVIGEKEVKEHVSKMDLWDLWDEEIERKEDG